MDDEEKNVYDDEARDDLLDNSEIDAEEEAFMRGYDDEAEETDQIKKLDVISESFGDGSEIPGKHTCEGEDVNPQLTIGDVPGKAEQLAIIMDDPDAPAGTFNHWVVWGLTPGENVDEASSPGIQGKNDFGSIGYKGPCPPPGKPHRYFLRVYALDSPLKLDEGASRGDLETAMQGHVLAKGETMGIFGR